MTTYRQMKLTDITGNDSIELNDFDGYLMTSPTGLGIYVKNSFLKIGNKRIRTDQQNAFNSITFYLQIYADTRENVETKYKVFRDFISKHRSKGFRLYYSANSDDYERYIVCDVQTIDKTEKRGVNYIEIPVVVEPRTLWKKDEIKSSIVQETENSNLFEFLEDTEYGDLVNRKYYVLKTITGSGDLTVPNYDFTKAPTQVNINVDGVVINNSSLISDGVYRKYDNYKIYELNINKDTEKLVVSVYDYYTDIVEHREDVYDVSITNDTITVAVRNGQPVENTTVVYYTYKTAYGVGRTAVVTIKAGESVGIVSVPNTSYYAGAKDIEFVLAREYVEDYAIDVEEHEVSGYILQGYTNNNVVKFALDEDTSQYCVAFQLGSANKSELSNDGDVEVSLKIKINGIAVNPEILLVDKYTNSVEQYVKLNAMIPQGAYLEINSDAENTGVWLVYNNTGAMYDYTKYIDLNSNMYLRLPQGSYNIVVRDSNDNVVHTDVFYSKEYMGA